MKIIIIIIVLFYFIYKFSKDFDISEYFFDDNDTKKIQEYIDIIDQINIKRINQISVYHINMNKDKDKESQLLNHFERYYPIPVKSINSLSHLLAIKTAYDNGEEISCIMEDDVYVNLLNIQDESLDDFVKEINNNLDWEILQLYQTSSNKLNKDFKIKNYTLHLEQEEKYPVCYLINRKGMEKILMFDKVKTYSVNPSLVISNNSLTILKQYKLDLSLLSKMKYKKEYVNNINIPKILWSYWDGPTNKLITSCISSWRKNLPDWEIIILNKETLFDYIFIDPKYLKMFNDLTIQKKTDLIRLKLLYNYGGCWIDCTTFINRNINEYLYEMIEKNLEIFFPVKGPYTLNNTKSWESYFIISSKGSYFTKKMYEKMENVLFKNESYIKLTKKQENKLELNNDYHLIYILYLNLLLDNKIYNNSIEQNYSRCHTTNNGMKPNLLFNYVIDLHIKYYNNIILSEEEIKIIKLYDLLKIANYQRKYYEEYGVSKVFSYNDVLKDFQNCLDKENNNIDLFTK